FLQLTIGLRQLGIRRSDLCVRIRRLVVHLGLLGAHTIWQRGGGLGATRLDAASAGSDCVGIARFNKTIEGLFVLPFGFGGSEFLVELVELGGGDVLLLIHAKDFVFFLVSNQFLLRALDLHLQIHLLFEIGRAS